MLYTEYMNKACEVCIGYNEFSGMAYLEPDYKRILKNAGLDPEIVTDYDDLYYGVVKEYINLEIIRQNQSIQARTQAVIDWLFDIITVVIDPATEKTNNDLVANMLQYLKVSNESTKKNDDMKKPIQRNYNFAKIEKDD